MIFHHIEGELHLGSAGTLASMIFLSKSKIDAFKGVGSSTSSAPRPPTEWLASIRRQEPIRAPLLSFHYGENSGDSAHAEPHFGTSPHFQLFSASRFFSRTMLQRKDSKKITRLAWAQEVPSSNLGAPTTNSLNYLRLFLSGISTTIQLGNIWEQLIAEQVNSVSLRTPTGMRIDSKRSRHVRMP